MAQLRQPQHRRGRTTRGSLISQQQDVATSSSSSRIPRSLGHGARGARQVWGVVPRVEARASRSAPAQSPQLHALLPALKAPWRVVLHAAAQSLSPAAVALHHRCPKRAPMAGAPLQPTCAAAAARSHATSAASVQSCGSSTCSRHSVCPSQQRLPRRQQEQQEQQQQEQLVAPGPRMPSRARRGLPRQRRGAQQRHHRQPRRH
jgi:hypothetical protein